MAKIAILGFGTVGSGVYEVLCRNAAGVSRRAGEPVEVKYILDPKDFSAHPAAQLFIKNFDTILEDPEIRVVVETIGGTRFAYPYVKACLESGRSVCTSNKEMVATYGAELLALAKAHNCAFLFEASVGGGTPIITPMHQCLAANVITEVEGIVNGTTNFMLTKMVRENLGFDEALKIAQELGYINIPENTLIDVEQMKNYTGEQLVLITTGSQGESMAALSRMAAHLHKKISILPGDTVIFSSHPIPGNEKAVSNVINELSAQGANVVFQDVHVSGHACQEEIKLIYSLVKPKYAIPVHGEYRHLKAHAEVAQSLGIPKENIFLMYSGDVMELDEAGAAVTGKVHTGAIMVDGLGVGDVGNIVLRDRQHLSEDGIMVVVLTLEKRTNQLLAGPDIVSRGFVYVRESEDLMGEAREVVEEALDGCLSKNISDWGKIKSTIKDALGDYVWKKTKRRPMILPIIMEA